jgi:transcriptional regulator with XRE-family HTH domain
MSTQSEDKYLTAFGKRFAEIRRKRGLTQESLAERAGISALSVSFIEQGRRWPRLGTLHKFAKCLDVTVDELLKGLKS